MIVTDIETFMIDFGDDLFIELKKDGTMLFGVFKIYTFIELKDDYLIGVSRVYKDNNTKSLIYGNDVEYYKLSEVQITDVTKTFITDNNIPYGLEIKEIKG